MLRDLPLQTQEATREVVEEIGQEYDFSSCQRLKKLTTHDIYGFTHQGTSLLVKLFSPLALPNYKQELSCLQCTNHPSLLPILHHRTAQDPSSPDPILNSHLIVVPEASRGDLNDYLPRYGRMEEKVARSFFRQLVEALQALSELQPPLIHPNLQPSSVLIGDDGVVRVCGWSQVGRGGEQGVREGVFACGELLVCLLTAFPPFYKKYSPTDTYFKFLSPEHIHKFWQELQKKVARSDKHFAFSSDVRDLLEAIFLRKYTTFSQIASHQWTRGDTYQPPELLRILEENESARNEKAAARRQMQAANDLKRQKALHDHRLTFGLARSGHDPHHDFLQDCEQNNIREEQMPSLDVPLGVKVDASPAFLIASLKELLRNDSGRNSVVLGEQFALVKHQVTRVCSSVVVELQFVVDVEEEEELLEPQIEQERANLSFRMTFRRYSGRVLVDLQVEKSHFNDYYTSLALTYLKDQLLKTPKQ